LAIVLGMQLKIGQRTIEESSIEWLQSSSVPKFLNQVASGGVLMIRNSGKASADFFSSQFGGISSESKAGRLNFEIKRSSNVERADEIRQ
jgi:hypothetical protein